MKNFDKVVYSALVFFAAIHVASGLDYILSGHRFEGVLAFMAGIAGLIGFIPRLRALDSDFSKEPVWIGACQLAFFAFVIASFARTHFL
jgi:hypothetical protein